MPQTKPDAEVIAEQTETLRAQLDAAGRRVYVLTSRRTDELRHVRVFIITPPTAEEIASYQPHALGMIETAPARLNEITHRVATVCELKYQESADQIAVRGWNFSTADMLREAIGNRVYQDFRAIKAEAI